jgi:2-oxoglutarate dehydrogenase complex dehydrogenase (E1) component-like enzyme
VEGHFAANLDPLGIWDRPTPPVLNPELYGFSEMDMDREYASHLSSGFSSCGVVHVSLLSEAALDSAGRVGS